MGDRFTLKLRCVYCGGINDDVWYPESTGVTNFSCGHCKKINEIVMNFSTRKGEE